MQCLQAVLKAASDSQPNFWAIITIYYAPIKHRIDYFGTHCQLCLHLGQLSVNSPKSLGARRF